MLDEFLLYTIYFSPSNHVNQYVVRRHVINAFGHSVADVTPLAVVDSLDAARAALSLHSRVILVRVARRPQDDSAIVETWA